MRRRTLALAGALLLAAAPARTASVEGTVRAAAANNEAGAASQHRVEKLDDDTEAMAAAYRAALETTRSLTVYDERLERLIESQKAEAESLTAQLETATQVSRQIVPLMERMVDALARFVDLDLPFLPEERHRRVAELRAMLDRADVTIAEQYRRILEAYQIENEYGRTIEAYRGRLETEGAPPRTVEFLRIGRLVLLYQTLDGAESGVWNAAQQAWQPISGYGSAIRDGIRMARKQMAPDLIRVPVPAAPAPSAAP